MKHSEHTPSMEEDNAHMIEESLQHKLLDLLIDGASSFAALYGALVRHCGYPASLKVSWVMDALVEMEQRGWVEATQMAEDGSFSEPTEDERRSNLLAYQAWLPEAEFDELSVDEVGLWYELTDKGRAEWKRWFSDEGHGHPQWMLDDLSDSQIIVIQAESLDIAEEALKWWLSVNPEINLLHSSKTIESAAAFTLRDGTQITNGVKLMYQYSR